ncbi:hypothetical protein DH2020_043872 [Rehmannia glutinosa]|uniref:1-phosphatidylinositol-3-phosphate 5-kinase n=1 Tax=Rehmannia glutinosa TaxID=99300 RepID=A0ABR0UJ34_REHGL
MGIPDSSLVDLIEKVKSWISWGNSDSNCTSRGLEMTDNNCCHCEVNILNSCLKYHCQSCGRLLCGKCVEGLASLDVAGPSRLKETTRAVFNIKTCKFCFELGPLSKSFECVVVKSILLNLQDKAGTTITVSDEDEGDDSTSHFFSTSTEYCHDTSDVDSVCVNARNDFYSFMSVGSSPSDSPSRIHITSNRVGHYVQQDQQQAVLEKPAKEIRDTNNVENTQPLDFETNGLIWFPPPDDDEENSFFTYDDEDDEVGDSNAMFSLNASFDSVFLAKEKLVDHKEPSRGVVKGHFRALVSQLLQGQGIISTEENCADDWLNIITAISWQAANFIKPDTSKGGSMDPCDYLKVKCVASGSPSERRSTQYQRVPNQLASFDTLLEQENDYLKRIVSKIEARRPNVLLVEKSVSSFAQDQLLAKEISLVLNVKRPVLERIARCTGAIITPSTDRISTARLGHCELFYLEKVLEDHEPVNQFNRRPSKTLMFFEGCPRRLGCTVLLRGSSNEELKKVKTVVQYAVFAAYHLSLETSFLADEGASLPMTGPKSSHFTPSEEINVPPINIGPSDLNLELGLHESLSELGDVDYDDVSISDEFRYRKALSEACAENLALDITLADMRLTCARMSTRTPMELTGQMEGQSGEVSALAVADGADGVEASTAYYSANDNNDSMLVSLSSHCILNGTSSSCGSCKESAEAHALCYTHQHGNLMINVRRLSSVNLPGEQDGKIWMWNRCLRCTYVDGVPPATRRVVMSDAAWGLSFGKFLELSFSNHASGNRVASCGHSLQRDCLRFYGSATFLLSKAEDLYAEISAVLQEINSRSLSSMHEFSDASDLHRHVLELNDMLAKEKKYYDLLQFAIKEIPEQDLAEVDILEINRLRHSLLIGSHVWDRRLYLLDSLLRRTSSPTAPNDIEALFGLKDSETYLKDCSLDFGHEEEECPEEPKAEPDFQENHILPAGPQKEWDGVRQYVESTVNSTSLERLPSAASILSDKIDSAWSGADLAPVKPRLLDTQNSDVSEAIIVRRKIQKENPSLRRLLSPARVHSFDSAQRLQERMGKVLPPSLHLSTLRSFHASGDYKYMVRDPVSNVQRTLSQVSPREAEKLNLTSITSRSFISSISLLPEGARLMVSQNGKNDIVVAVYYDEPTSVISYAISSKDYVDWIADKPNGPERGSNYGLINKVNSIASDLSTWQSFGSLDLDYMQYGNSSSEDASAKSSPHVRISFEDESLTASGKVKFSVTCYFAKQFDALRRRCCPSDLDFVRSLSRCRRWSAQGGKSNVYFAKTFDERFIIKQVTKTELESFDEFAPEYFKYLTDALSSGSPTCLAKVLGIYQVSVKHSKGGRETKMDLMVMENLFFRRSISKVYDLKGSARSRYNSDTTGANKVLLDMNLLETLRTNPIFLGSKSKRRLERAVWNDTSFLASVDVMDYSLLVGVDEDRKELVLGIIDYMRQYTWDKHLETWVKASGILGGPKNATPTIWVGFCRNKIAVDD